MSHRLPLIAGLAAVSFLALVRPTYAADLDYGYGDAPPPVAEEKVEFGTGWYIRGDMGVDKSYDAVASDLVPGQTPHLSQSSSTRPGYDASIGGGYKFTNGFRSDVVVDFQQPISVVRTGKSYACPIGVYGTPSGATTYTGRGFLYTTCAPQLQGDLKSYDALVNLYYDFAYFSRVTPYVGAGAGVAFGHYTSSANWYTPNGTAYNFDYTDPVTSASLNINYDKRSAGSYQNFAWALMAGVAIDVYDHTKLDIGYRYLNLGSIAGTNVHYHQVRAGIRYMIDD